MSSSKVNNQQELPSKYDIDDLTEHELLPAAKKTKTRDSVYSRPETNHDVTNTSYGSQLVYDEFYHFGMNIAHQLRAMPIDEALECQTDLMDYIARKRRHIFGMNHVNKK